MSSPNQNPEQVARDAIDAQLATSGWVVQDKTAIDFNAGQGQAVREYTTDTGPADYVLFVDSQPVGVIEAKREEAGQSITTAEDQTEGYASAKLKWVQNNGIPLPFLYEATGVITRFTDQLVEQDPTDDPASQLLARIHAQREAATANKAPKKHPTKKTARSTSSAQTKKRTKKPSTATQSDFPCSELPFYVHSYSKSLHYNIFGSTR